MIRLLAVLSLLLSTAVFAKDFPPSANIYLVDSDERELQIGEVNFVNTDSGATSVKVSMDFTHFTGHFLSMRPFQCIEGNTEWFCYLPYPYDLRSLVTRDNLSDLEYQLLFIRKISSQYGIDAWNGLYYKLQLQDDGSLTGTLLEGDLNVLQSPPAEKYAKPVDLGEFIEANKSSRLFPSIRIY